MPLFPLTGETSLKRHDQYGPEHVNTDYHLHTTNCMVEYWRGNWTVSDDTAHASVTGQYLANAIISDKSK